MEIKEGSSTIASFTYDVLERRIEKTEGGTTTEYLYDGLDAMQETQGANAVPILTGLGIDERFARGSGTNRHYFLTDGLGSTRLLADGTGGIIQGYDYDPYGGTHPANSTVQNPYRYTGREQDETGLYYYRARYYHSGMERFVSEDPIGLAGGLNGYAYVRGNPISFIDPLGLVDLNLVSPGDRAHRGMNAIPSRAGIFSVGVHFDDESFYGPDNELLTPVQVADLIRNSQGYNGSDLVELYSCRAGASIDGSLSAAQVIANTLENKVRTSDQWVFVGDTQGYLGSYPKVDGGMDTSGPKGVWRIFSP